MKEYKTNLRRIVKSSIIVFICVILSKLLSYGFRVGVARYYGPEVYGSITLILAIMGLFVTIASLGLVDGLSRYVPRHIIGKERSKAKYLIKFVSATVLVSSIIFGIAFYLSAEFIQNNFFRSQDVLLILKIFAILIPVWVMTNVYSYFINSIEKITMYALLSDVVPNVIRVAIISIAIYLGWNSDAVYVSYAVSMIVVLIASFFTARYYSRRLLDNAGPLKNKDKISLRSDIISYSWPIILTGLIVRLSTWIDSIMIGYLMTEAQVGFYNTALPIAMLLGMTPELFFPLFFPLINREYASGNIKMVKDLTKRVSKWILIINLPLFFFIFSFPGAALNILFGSEYIVAENSLRILSVGLFVVSLLIISSKVILMAGKSKFLMYNSFAIIILNIVLNIFLIKMFGISGAAIATCISLIISYILVSYKAYKTVGINPLGKNFLRILAAGLISMLLVVFIKNFLEINYLSIICLSIMFVLVYFTLILLFKGLDKEDFDIVKDIRNKIKRTTGRK